LGKGKENRAQNYRKSFRFDVSPEEEGDKRLLVCSEKYASKEEVAHCTDVTA
jgi:hypothetical protein